jgi:hypothetical protein
MTWIIPVDPTSEDHFCGQKYILLMHLGIGFLELSIPKSFQDFGVVKNKNDWC